MALFREVDGWTYEVFPLTEPASSFGVFTPFVELWNAKRVDGRLPAWRDFELRDVEPWLGWFSVADVHALHPIRLQYRLWGAAMSEALGEDLTGQEISEGVGGYDQDDFDFLERVVTDRQFGQWSGSVFWKDRDYVTIDLLTVLLADDGENVDKIMTAAMETI